MQTHAPRIPFPVEPILPHALRAWAEPLAPALQKLLVPSPLIGSLERARQSGTGARFAESLLESLEIRFAVSGADLRRIPEHGPAVLVANHPYGILEGLILMVVLDRIRPDFKLLANSWLAWLAEVNGHMIFVNPFETTAAHLENRAPLRHALTWLAGGGLMIAFPAGEVAHVDFKEQSVTDPPWKSSAARLALRARCAVVPAFFEGANSVPFQVAGLLHPGLRTMALALEFSKMRGRTVRFRIGSPIPSATIAGYPDPAQATAYMRHRTFFLANRAEFAEVPAPSPRTGTIAPPALARLLWEEVGALPADSELVGDANFSVRLARSAQIPLLLREIGRCRELAFRKVGEGTGQEVDIDRFDEYYQHLFLWSKKDLRLAGAYRLAVTTDVLPRLGISGLYTSTLFRFHPRFFERTGPAIELGRSFVMPEYQRNYAALLLLWKGIMRVVQRADAPILFGAVSISSNYSAVSRSLIAAYLSDRASHDMAKLVAPQRKFCDRSRRNWQVKRFAALAAGIEDLSLSIADIEHDGKGVPVLIRQYLRAGGRVLAFSVDANFSNTLDALMLADLSTASPALLERCMGRKEAQAFLAARNATVAAQGVS